MLSLPVYPAGARPVAYSKPPLWRSPASLIPVLPPAPRPQRTGTFGGEDHEADNPIEAFGRALVDAGYAHSTIQNYLRCAAIFIRSLRPADALVGMSGGEIAHRAYALHLSGGTGATETVWMQALSAFFGMVHNRTLAADIAPAARRGTLYSALETRKIFAAVGNAKHRATMLLIYALDLSICDAVRLRVSQVHIDRGCISLCSGGAADDGRIRLEDELATLVEEYIQRYTPARFLFEGREGGPYSERRLQQILQAALATVGCRTAAGYKALRISFQKHLAESNGYVYMLRDALRRA